LIHGKRRQEITCRRFLLPVQAVDVAGRIELFEKAGFDEFPLATAFTSSKSFQRCPSVVNFVPPLGAHLRAISQRSQRAATFT
jgi:hypothetical protein